MKCYIFDIDGTIANCKHRLGYIAEKPKRWKMFEETAHLDEPIMETIAILRALQAQNYHIVLCTGRGEKMRRTTTDWLYAYNVPYNVLYMRKLDDYRADDIVKEELYREMLKAGFEVMGVFEDRQRVVDMWRRNGVRCYQVDSGEF
jgi:uncharacterized HAD superfamily protein